MKFSQKFFVKFCKNKDLWALEKKERFRLLFNLETLKIQLWRDSNPRPWALQSVTLPTIPNFLMRFFSKFLSQMLKFFLNLSVAESPVGSSSNRRFRLKRQKTKNANNFWCRPCICMKLSHRCSKLILILILSNLARSIITWSILVYMQQGTIDLDWMDEIFYSLYIWKEVCTLYVGSVQNHSCHNLNVKLPTPLHMHHLVYLWIH